MSGQPLSNPNNSPQSSSGSGGKIAAGCGVGCLVTAIIVVVVVVVGIIWGVNFVKSLPEKYTAAEPIEIQTVVGTEDEVAAVHSDFDAFRDALANGREAETLKLTSDEINLLISTHPDFKEVAGKAQLEFIDDTIQADLSVPLDGMGELVEGRYFNGRATFKFNYVGGTATYSVKSVEMNGNTIPKMFIDGFVEEINKNDPMSDPELDDIKTLIDAILVEDGVLKIVPKPAAERGK